MHFHFLKRIAYFLFIFSFFVLWAEGARATSLDGFAYGVDEVRISIEVSPVENYAVNAKELALKAVNVLQSVLPKPNPYRKKIIVVSAPSYKECDDDCLIVSIIISSNMIEGERGIASYSILEIRPKILSIGGSIDQSIRLRAPQIVITPPSPGEFHNLLQQNILQSMVDISKTLGQ
jgi:hypothetical protein